MPRMTVDCRTIPSDSHCSLTISGEPDEVLRAAVAHAVDVHGHVDGDELRAGLEAALAPSTALETKAGEFVQIIEFRTGRIEEFADVEQQWLDAIGDDRTARWDLTCVDRNAPQRYLQVVGFPSVEAAEANSKHQATSRFAEVLRGLCDGEPTFHDLDVVEVKPF